VTSADRLVQLAGAALVGLVLADVFFTVLFPASGSGPVRRPLSRWVWRSFRLLGRRLRPPRRHRLLAYSGPVQITATIAVWVLLVTAGWAMVFQPALGTAVVATDGSTDTGWATALYVSGFSLTTLGTGDVVPITAPYRLFMIMEAGLGLSGFTLVLTYFLSVYGTITQHKTSAALLHQRTFCTGDPVQLIVGLADDGALPGAGQELSWLADLLGRTYQTHHSYPVLRYFHYRDAQYTLPRLLLLSLDTTALLRSALDGQRYRTLLRSPGLEMVSSTGLQLLEELIPHAGCEPSEDEEQDWRRHFTQAAARLRAAGIDIPTDVATSCQEYLSLRARWNQPLRSLAEAMLYEWSEIDPLSRPST